MFSNLGWPDGKEESNKSEREGEGNVLAVKVEPRKGWTSQVWLGSNLPDQGIELLHMYTDGKFLSYGCSSGLKVTAQEVSPRTSGRDG